jgi:SAM-dependent methyltransferase
MLMSCPLCKTEHPLLVRGIVKNLEDESRLTLADDRGYAFCNCRNIFYTDWSNIDQRIYDQAYFDKYQHNDSKHIYEAYSKEYFDKLLSYNPGISSFCEIGAINNSLLNVAKEKGWRTIRLDINKASTDDEHEIITGDIEKPEVIKKLFDIDVIWMSHLVEHLLDPVQTMKNVHGCLNKDGLVFIAMPDPYFIDWSSPQKWAHWALREHHILWDMDSFIELMEELGYENLVARRNLNATLKFICVLDYHLIFRKK